MSEFGLSRQFGVICRASGRHQNLPKFHILLFIWLLIKNTVTPATPRGADYAYGCHRSGKHMRKIKATFLWHVNCKITWIETKKGFRWFLTRRHKETFPSILLLMCLTVTHPECCRRYKHTCITLQTNHRYQKEFAHLMHISIRIVLLMQGKPKPLAMHVIYFFSKWWILKHRLCGCAYLVSGRVLSSSDGPSRLSVFGDWNTTTENRHRYSEPPDGFRTQ